MDDVAIPRVEKELPCFTATTHITVRAVYGTSEIVTLWSAPSALGDVKRIVRSASRADGPGLIYTWESSGVDRSLGVRWR